MKTPRDLGGALQDCFAHKKVCTKAELLDKCRCSSMTLWRSLSQEGYFTSYNYNAKYYTLSSIPRFDDLGLWSYEDIRFSRWGTLPKTVVALVETSPGGMTAKEVANVLHVQNIMPLLTRLTLQQRLGRETSDGTFRYLAVDPSRRACQLRQAAPVPSRPLPKPEHIVALLVEIIRRPGQSPQQWARRLSRHGTALRAQDIRAVLEHFQLDVKKGLLKS
jgi:hypothetical protein